MAQSKTKVMLPKEVSLETHPKTEFLKVVLPKDENKHFDEDDELVTSTTRDVSIPKGEDKETPNTTDWDHATETLIKLSSAHPDGNSLQMGVKYRNKDSMEQFFQCVE